MRAAAVTAEAELQAQVISLARWRGFLVYHTYDSRRSPPGFPDLVLVRPPCLYFVELKSERGKLSPDQELWLDTLAGATNSPEVYVWRPSSWGEIETTLARNIPAPGSADNTGRGGHATGTSEGRFDRSSKEPPPIGPGESSGGGVG
jgi:hypothetical protein